MTPVNYLALLWNRSLLGQLRSIAYFQSILKHRTRQAAIISSLPLLPLRSMLKASTSASTLEVTEYEERSNIELGEGLICTWGCRYGIERQVVLACAVAGMSGRVRSRVKDWEQSLVASPFVLSAPLPIQELNYSWHNNPTNYAGYVCFASWGAKTKNLS